MKKWLRRISSIVAASVLTVSLSVAPGVLAADTESVLTEGQEGLLRHLGVITEPVPEYTHQLTRGELAHIAARVSNAAEYTGDALYFYDVEESHPYYQDIYALTSGGVLSGDGDGYFRPDDTVSDLEICKIFGVILGYRDIANFKSYLRIARDAELDTGVNMDGVVTYGEALMMAYNTLHAEMYEAVTYGAEKDYRTTDGYLAIERYHNLVQQKGIVDGVPFTTLVRPDGTIEEGKLRIGGRVFQYGDESLFGKAVVFYSVRKSDNTTDTAIQYLHVDENLTDVFALAGKDVKGIDTEKLTYYVESKEKSVKLDGSPDVIINGVAYPEYQEADLKPANGTVTLIDNNNDQKYDVILVEAYEYVVVKGVDEESNIITGKFPAITIGSKERNVDIRVTRGRGQLRLNSLKEDTVIKVLRSKNTDGTLKIRINLIEGVTGQAEALGDRSITVAGTKYTINEGTVTDDTVLIGEMVTVYPDGEVVAAILHASGDMYQFGYLLDVSQKGSVFSSTLEFRLVDLSRTMHEVSMGKALIVDEIKFDDADAILTRLTSANALRSISSTSNIKTLAEEGNQKWPYSQPVRYRFNDAGELTHLDTVIYESAYELEDSLRPLNGTESVMESYSYDHGNMSFYTSYNDENGFVFSLPDTTAALQVPAIERDRVELYRNDRLSGNVSVEGFTMDEDSRLVKYALVHYNVERDIRVDYNKAWIVSDISTVLDGDGVPVRQVTLVSNANPKTLVLPGDTQILLKDGTTTTELNIGDIVQYDSDLTGAISVMNKLMDVSKGLVPSDKRLVDGDSSSYDYSILRKDFRVVYGTVLAINGSVLTHTTSVKDDLMGIEAKKSLHNYRALGDTKYFMYEEIGGTPVVNPTTASQIIPYTANPDSGQKAVMLVRNGSLQAVLVIKEG